MLFHTLTYRTPPFSRGPLPPSLIILPALAPLRSSSCRSSHIQKAYTYNFLRSRCPLMCRPCSILGLKSVSQSPLRSESPLGVDLVDGPLELGDEGLVKDLGEGKFVLLAPRYRDARVQVVHLYTHTTHTHTHTHTYTYTYTHTRTHTHTYIIYIYILYIYIHIYIYMLYTYHTIHIIYI